MMSHLQCWLIFKGVGASTFFVGAFHPCRVGNVPVPERLEDKRVLSKPWIALQSLVEFRGFFSGMVGWNPLGKGVV